MCSRFGAPFVLDDLLALVPGVGVLLREDGEGVLAAIGDTMDWLLPPVESESPQAVPGFGEAAVQCLETPEEATQEVLKGETAGRQEPAAEESWEEEEEEEGAGIGAEVRCDWRSAA